MQLKQVQLRKAQAIGESGGMGKIEGYIAVFRNLDGNGDVVDPGAFTKSLRALKERKQATGDKYLFPILWQHDEHCPIGGWTDAYEDDYGLFGRGEIDLDIREGQHAYSAIKQGYMRGLSIGYNTVDSYIGTDYNRHLKEILLWEGSPVTFPANPRAVVTSVKSRMPQEDFHSWWDGLIRNLDGRSGGAVTPESKAHVASRLERLVKSFDADLDVYQQSGTGSTATDRLVAEYRAACTAARKAGRAEPPHPIHNRDAWQEWKLMDDWMRLHG